ncbi:hypothetical protein [Priestia endophytica]|uniref:hypothetical protein n=1 Tax=Priestia endophytica TaxID=135735 RepID=UPI00203CB6E2|nr:hypothetical protein [Priestia endophytica]MCM3541328.1 hypothetical protein [Priestia endophytica]
MIVINTEPVKIIRFDNYGFITKPYNSSTVFHHSFPFLNVEITDLFSQDITIEESDIIKPKAEDKKWSGCFVFLKTYDKNLPKGALSMRRGHKKNVGYLMSTQQKVWVRNTTHMGLENKYVNSYLSRDIYEGKEYVSEQLLYRLGSYYWVQMRVDLALKRIELGRHHLGYIPEWLSECFLMEEQVKQLDFSYLTKLRQKWKEMNVRYLKQNIEP